MHIAEAREESQCAYALDVCVPALCGDVDVYIDGAGDDRIRPIDPSHG